MDVDHDPDRVSPAEKRQKTENSGNGVTAHEFDPTRPVPQLDGVTESDLQVAIRVLEAVAALNKSNRKNGKGKANKDGLELYQQKNLRPFRKALAPCLELHKRQMYEGKSEEQHYKDLRAARTLRRQKTAEKAQQKNYIAATTLRRGRVERLLKLKEEAKEEEMQKMSLLVPDGHVETGKSNQSTTMLIENGTSEETNGSNADAEVEDGDPVRLPIMRSCYACKVRYRELHPFYDQLCTKCAPLNWEKRHQTADLTGKVAVVTGSRVKIGFQTCLKLLRAGATVVATTRFPNSAAETYRTEKDFNNWGNRLFIYGLDLRDITGLEAFTRFLKMKYTQGIDILINNACQTIRRPRGYYLPILAKERKLWANGDQTHKSLLGDCAQFEHVRGKLFLEHRQPDRTSNGIAIASHDGVPSNAPLLQLSTGDSPGDSIGKEEDSFTSLVTSTTNGCDKPAATFESSGLSHSAAMSQMIILPEDAGVSDDVLPPGVSDVNGQQLDLRKTNSWLLKMEQVSTPEVLECMFINAIAPFVLNSRLKPLMTAPNTPERPDRFIINVSAMEGKFYRYKMPNHPHTNMAKAALNMMTRTSAEDLASQHRIFMNSVDTGWINDENPLERANKTAKTNFFQTPIDEIDAAARILDPVFSGVNAGRDGKKDYGKFLKDFSETEW